MLAWMDEGGGVGVFDATNTTCARRKVLVDLTRAHSRARNDQNKTGVRLIFIESICDDPRVLAANRLQKVRVRGGVRGC